MVQHESMFVCLDFAMLIPEFLVDARNGSLSAQRAAEFQALRSTREFHHRWTMGANLFTNALYGAPPPKMFTHPIKHRTSSDGVEQAVAAFAHSENFHAAAQDLAAKDKSVLVFSDAEDQKSILGFILYTVDADPAGEYVSVFIHWMLVSHVTRGKRLGQYFVSVLWDTLQQRFPQLVAIVCWNRRQATRRGDSGNRLTSTSKMAA